MTPSDSSAQFSEEVHRLIKRTREESDLTYAEACGVLFGVIVALILEASSEAEDT